MATVEELAQELDVKPVTLKEAVGLQKNDRNDTELSEDAEKIAREKFSQPEESGDEPDNAFDEAQKVAEERVGKADVETPSGSEDNPNVLIRLTRKVESVYRNTAEYPCQRDGDAGWFIEVPFNQKGDIEQNLIEQYGREVLQY